MTGEEERELDRISGTHRSAEMDFSAGFTGSRSCTLKWFI